MQNNYLVFSLYMYIYIYIITFLFFIIFLYIKNFQNSLNNSIDYNVISTNSNNKLHFWLFVCSLAGVPPLLGFFPKFLLFLTLLNLQKYNFVLIFLIANSFILVFYLQQIRFFQTNKKKFYKLYKNQKNDTNLHSLIVIFQIFNIFALFYLPVFINLLYVGLWF